MKKILTYLIIIIVGAACVYYGLTVYNIKEEPKERKSLTVKESTNEVIPSKDDFVKEAIKLQTLAEGKNNNETCTCYNPKDLDINTSLSGSILVYTVDDLFTSSLWLSNGYYLLNESENVATGLLETSSDQASLNCGEEAGVTEYKLCAKNY